MRHVRNWPNLEQPVVGQESGTWPEGQECSAPAWRKRAGTERDSPARCWPVAFRNFGEPLGQRAVLHGVGVKAKGLG